ncbi:MAG: hypothetical protein GF398_13165 [Chitinivibrionales bacterium]|nr:hypothetical protein [Chitinivibrionales bacterium]
MQYRIQKKRIVVSILAAVMVVSLQAQVGAIAPMIRLSLDGGVVAPTDKEAAYWNPGFSIAPTALLFLNENALLGARFEYSVWTPNEDEVLDAVTDNIQGASVEGLSSTWTIMPTFRLGSFRDFEFLNYYAQGGIGVYIRQSDATVEGTLNNVDSEISVVETNQSRLGAHLAAGLVLGNIEGFSVEIMPTYDVIFLQDRTAQDFGASVALSLAM